ncbi:MAG: cation:proton antiporter [Gemmatimonadota bacterium]
MIDQPLLHDLGMILLVATGVTLLARTVQIPSIIAYILAGLLLGPVLGVVEISHTMELIAEVGIILLLFLVGLELSLDKIREVGKVAFGAGLSQVAITGAGIALIAWMFGLSPGDILFLGIALTFSSTVVVVKLLDELRALDHRHGRIAVGILLVQDLVVVIVLTFVAGMSGDEEMAAATLLRDLSLAFGGMAVLLVSATLLAWKALPPLFDWMAKSQEGLLAWSLAWCFLLVLGSELLGLSLELGAFIAGVALAQLPYNHDLRRRVHPLMNFFVAIFFVTLGVQMEMAEAISAWPLVLTLVVATLLLKPPLVAWLVRLHSQPPRVALRAGLTLGQTSEFSFILAALALGNGLIDQALLSIVGAVGLLTMGFSSISILRGDALVNWFDRRGFIPLLTGARSEGISLDEGAEEHGPREGHVIVVGMNSLGRRIVEFLQKSGEDVLAVDTDPAKLAGLPCSTLLGNAEYLSVMEEAGVQNAQLLVSALHIEDVNRLLAYRGFRWGIPTVIHAYDENVERELQGLDVAHLLNSRGAGVDRMTEELARHGVFGR